MTNEQHKALRARFDRDASGYETFDDMLAAVQPTFGCDEAVTVQWCGMWLCVEQDGYTHT